MSLLSLLGMSVSSWRNSSWYGTVVSLYYIVRWLDEGEDDGLTDRTLTVLPQPGDPWTVTTVTSTEKGAGTQGPASLVLYTDKGKSKPLMFGDEPNTMFEDGQTQNFPICVSILFIYITFTNVETQYSVLYIIYECYSSVKLLQPHKIFLLIFITLISYGHQLFCSLEKSEICMFYLLNFVL